MPGLRSFPTSGSIRALGEDAADGRDRQLDIAGGLALQVEQPPVDHLLGPKRDLGGGLIGVGVELDPADAITRRQGDRAEFVVTRRRGARRRRPGTGPSRRWRPGRAPSDTIDSADVRCRQDPWTARRPSRMRPAPACLAGRARGRPRTSARGRLLVGVIRLGGGPVVAAAARAILGSSFIASARARKPAPAPPAASNSRDSAVNRQFIDEHGSQHLPGKGRRRGRGGLSGRELDRGLRCGFAQVG